MSRKQTVIELMLQLRRVIDESRSCDINYMDLYVVLTMLREHYIEEGKSVGLDPTIQFAEEDDEV